MTKTITNFGLDLSSISASGEVRDFVIAGDTGAGFILEIKNEDNYYYNFVTNKFQAAQSDLEQSITGGGYSGSIKFPRVGDADEYNISLYAKPGTKHVAYNEARFADNSIDINSSTGSNSLMMKKVIYQYLDVTLTITPFSLSGNVECGSVSSDTVVIPRGKSKAKTNFSISCAVTTATKAYKLIKQPTQNDLFSYVSPVVGSAPVNIPGEDIYPAHTASGVIDSNVSSSTSVALTEDAAGAGVLVGDRITGFALEADNPIITVSSISGEDIVVSSAISVSSGVTVKFFKRKNYRWPVNNFVHLIKPGMFVQDGSNITSISDYLDVTTLNAGTVNEQKVVNEAVGASEPGGNIPVISEGIITTLAGNIILDSQQLLSFAGNTLKVGNYGPEGLLSVHGYNTEFTDVKATLTTITTTTTAAVNKSANVAIADRGGILNGSVVSGIGIDASAANPTISSGASSLDGAGTIVLSAVQTLEKNRTLTFAGSSTTVTVTGNVKVNKSGTASQTVNIDIDRFISIT